MTIIVDRKEIDGVLSRQCVICPTWYPDSLRTRCPVCDKEYFRLYRQSNPQVAKKSTSFSNRFAGCFEGVSEEEEIAMKLGVNAFMKLGEG